MRISSSEGELIDWKSYDRNGKQWFQAQYSMTLEIVEASDSRIAERLQTILKVLRSMQPHLFKTSRGVEIETKLDFERDWGLGSSSTLLNNMANWADVDALELSRRTLGGSGYDVATAMHACPILYVLDQNEPKVEEVHFNPSFKDKLWFVHLGKKEDSSRAVKAFAEIKTTEEQIESITSLTEDLLKTTELSGFQEIIQSHEQLMELILQRPSASSRFSDYAGGVVKYLGAWGGDFMLVTGEKSDLDYFKVKGLETIVSFEQMIAST
jgi:mevalonate kinase